MLLQIQYSCRAARVVMHEPMALFVRKALCVRTCVCVRVRGGTASKIKPCRQWGCAWEKAEDNQESFACCL